MRWGVSWAGALAVACTAAEPGDRAIDSTRGSIVGGTLAAGDPAVVQVRFPAAWCSGTLIAPNVVVTAAHCFDDVTEPAGGTVHVGAGVAAGFDQVVETDAVYVHRRWTGLVREADLAFVRLAEEVNEVSPLPWRSEPLGTDMLGERIRIVGFGMSDGHTGEGAGEKRSANVTLDAMSPELVGFGDARQNICYGDSGGPVIFGLGSSQRVIAVHSFGFRVCEDQSYATRTDRYGELIREVVDGWWGPCRADGACVTDGCRTPDPDCGPCGFDGQCDESCVGIDLDCADAGGPGDPCASDGDCQSRLCAEAVDDPRVRYCSAVCDFAQLITCDFPLTICDQGLCRYVPPTPTAQGAACERHDQCRSTICDLSEGICVEPCAGDGACPADYACADVEGTRACTVRGCSAGPRGGAGGWWLAALGIAYLVARRR